MEEAQGDITRMKEKVVSQELKPGNGAQFWVYLSQSNRTAEYVTEWRVKLEQDAGNWSGTITSESSRRSLQTPGLSGIFKVTATAKLYGKLIEVQLEPQAGSRPSIGCNANCAAIIGIVATPGGDNAKYWTVWNAFAAKAADSSTGNMRDWCGYRFLHADLLNTS